MTQLLTTTATHKFPSQADDEEKFAEAAKKFSVVDLDREAVEPDLDLILGRYRLASTYNYNELLMELKIPWLREGHL